MVVIRDGSAGAPVLFPADWPPELLEEPGDFFRTSFGADSVEEPATEHRDTMTEAMRAVASPGSAVAPKKRPRSATGAAKQSTRQRRWKAQKLVDKGAEAAGNAVADRLGCMITNIVATHRNRARVNASAAHVDKVRSVKVARRAAGEKERATEATSRAKDFAKTHRVRKAAAEGDASRAAQVVQFEREKAQHMRMHEIKKLRHESRHAVGETIRRKGAGSGKGSGGGKGKGGGKGGGGENRDVSRRADRDRMHAGKKKHARCKKNRRAIQQRRDIAVQQDGHDLDTECWAGRSAGWALIVGQEEAEARQRAFLHWRR